MVLHTFEDPWEKLSRRQHTQKKKFVAILREEEKQADKANWKMWWCKSTQTSFQAYLVTCHPYKFVDLFSILGASNLVEQ